MKIAFVSDIHANLQAWMAVLLDIRSAKADLLICLGDLVGYGPNPAEVVASVCANANYCVLGNHDAALCNKIDTDGFSEVAARSLEWTRGRVGPKAVHYLSLLPLTIAAGGFRCAHGEFSAPAHFNYVYDPPEASPSWRAVGEQILFVGHTHHPGIYVIGRSGQPHRLEPQAFALEKHKRYLVNVGSVGQPRGVDVRAAYCIYDLDAAAVYWRRVPFDLDAFREALRRNAIPEAEIPFLRHDPLAGQRSVRELAGFRPSDKAEDAAQDVVTVQTIDLLRRNVRRWRRTAWILIVVCALATLAAAWYWLFAMRHPATIGADADSASFTTAGIKGVNLLPVPHESSTAGAPIAGWTVQLADGRRQAVALARAESGVPAFALSSELADGEIAIVSRPVAIAPGMKLTLQGLFKKSADFSGYVVVTIRFTGGAEPGASPRLIVREPNLPRQGGWLAVKHTFDVPANTGQVEIQVGGKFKGSVEVKELSLVRKE